MFDINSKVHFVTATIAAAGVLVVAYVHYRYEKNKLPRKWTRVGSLDNIYVYPVKSCAPVKVNHAECTYLGLKQGWLRDRVFMLIDDNNNFISARAYPELLLVTPSVESSILTLRHVDLITLNVNLAKVIEEEQAFNATIWGCNVPVIDCGSEASEWFSKLLSRANSKFRLVYYSAQKCRELKKIHKTHFYKFMETDTGALPEDTSFNLINNASIDDLNSRLGDVKVDHRYYRPNFTVEGAKILDEDKWKYIKIGENIFEVIKPCIRCALTTVDPDTGIGDPKMESLEMLKSYRQFEDPLERKFNGYAPRMGLLIALRSAPGGRIALHDDVYVSYK